MRIARRVRRTLLTLAACAAALGPGTGARAYGPWGSYTMGGIAFDRGTNGCFGPVVGVYGDPTLKPLVLQTAADYCNAQLASGAGYASAVDVEWADGGDSCAGMAYAADHADDNEVGASALFASSCVGIQAVNPRLLADSPVGVDVVEAIANCGAAATSPQGGAPFTGTAGACTGAAPVSGSPAACASPLPANTFPYPDDISVLTSQLLWNPASANWPSDLGLIGGCPGTTPYTQTRTSGSAAEEIWCYNIYAVGVDNCGDNSVAGPQGGSGGLVAAICGNPYSNPATAAVDAIGTIGMVDRASVVIDPNVSPALDAGDSLETRAPIQQCGIVSLGGNSGYNRACDPLAVATAAQPYAGTNPGDGAPTCKGDLQVTAGTYPAWGYVHLDLNAAATANGANAEARDYAQFVADPGEQLALAGLGYLGTCQMQVLRSPDGGPYKLTVGATC